MGAENIPPLRFNVPIDPENENDVLLHDRFYLIPNGLRQTVVKMALIKLLPADDEGLRVLLGDALLEQSKSGRRRGRAKAIVAIATESRVENGARQSTAQVEQVTEVKKVEPVIHGESQAEVVQVAEAKQVGVDVSQVQQVEKVVVVPVTAVRDDLSGFAGLLGDHSWANR